MKVIFGHDVFPLELHNKMDEIERGVELKKIKEIQLDFSNTRWFTAGSLILLIVVINYLRNVKRLQVKILLPSGKTSEDQVKAKKARDFLRRWKFFEVSKFYFGDVEQLLETSQYYRYLIDEDPVYYLRPYYQDEEGNLLELYSTSVIEISHFTDKIGNKSVITFTQIKKRLSDYAQERILDIVAKGINWKEPNTRALSQEFVIKCIREPLVNAYDHAEASIGLITAQINDKHFIISIADNGAGIPKTIKPVYEYFSKKIKGEISDAELIKYAFNLPDEEEVKMLLGSIKKVNDTGLIEFSSLEGVTSAPETHKGMGLPLLKDFVGRARGFMDVHSGTGYVRFGFDPSSNKVLSLKRKTLPFIPGTFVSIYLPRKMERKKWKRSK